MHSHYAYWSHIYHYGYPPTPYQHYSKYTYNQIFREERRQAVKGRASWTNGGPITQCGIPWSHNEYMTAAVGKNSPYRCGQNIKIRNLSTPGTREVIVTIVDQVPNYPANKISLHRRAFEALGASPGLGLVDIEIIPSLDLEEEKWGKYLLEVTQTAYPGYNITDYQFIRKTALATNEVQETYDYVLKSPAETITIRGNVIYNPNTNRILSFDIKEV